MQICHCAALRPPGDAQNIWKGQSVPPTQAPEPQNISVKKVSNSSTRVSQF